MRVSVEWLKEYVSTKANAEEIGSTLTMLGIELEAIEDSEIGPVLNFKVTPNRGDCLSVLGLARELCAKESSRYQPTELMHSAIKGFPLGDENTVCVDASVQIIDENLCPRYGARVFHDTSIGQSSSLIQKRIIACGMRPINVIVDITNYVMLELGQPLHAFDLEKLREKKIVVRQAKRGEKLTTLDGEERELDANMLMICDAQSPVAVAGVMGGLDSEVTTSTKHILLESAHFDASSVRRTRKKLGMSTEASYRFERYVDPEGVIRALNRFAQLYEKESRCKSAPGVIDVYPMRYQPKKITVREQRWNTLLGMNVPIASAASSLITLGCKVHENGNALEVTPPSWRNDLLIEDDFVEEIGRVWGYEKIPELLPQGSTPLGGEYSEAKFYSDARNTMLRLGFTEVHSHTFREKSITDPECEYVEIRNPISPELRFLRPSLLHALCDVAQKHRTRPLRLFETGKVFTTGKEEMCLAGFLSGRLLEEHWANKQSPPADFFTLKGIIEELFRILSRDFHVSESSDLRFHPNRQANIQTGSETVGIMGQLKTPLCEELNIPAESFVFEINLDLCYQASSVEPQYKHISPYPAVRRDIAFAISKEVKFSSIENAIKNSISDVLENFWLFDVYEGKGVEEGHHSLAVAVVLRHKEKTLTDEEANEYREIAFRAVEKFGAVRR